jgi:hypothetical protein
MEFRRELIGEQAYTAGVESLASDPETPRVARWILNFLQAD